MAITEQERLEGEQQDILKHIEYNSSVIIAAAKYERLIGNKDFLAVLNDLKGVKEVLDAEVLMLSKQIALTDDDNERKTVQNEFLTKAIRRMLTEEAYSYADRIIHEATNAKEENVVLKKQLKEKFNAEA